MVKTKFHASDSTILQNVAPSVQYKQLRPMARVSASKSKSNPRRGVAAQVSEFSINTLRSEQEEEEGITCVEWCANGKMAGWGIEGTLV